MRFVHNLAVEVAFYDVHGHVEGMRRENDRYAEGVAIVKEG